MTPCPAGSTSNLPEAGAFPDISTCRNGPVDKWAQTLLRGRSPQSTDFQLMTFQPQRQQATGLPSWPKGPKTSTVLLCRKGKEVLCGMGIQDWLCEMLQARRCTTSLSAKLPRLTTARNGPFRRKHAANRFCAITPTNLKGGFYRAAMFA